MSPAALLSALELLPLHRLADGCFRLSPPLPAWAVPFFPPPVPEPADAAPPAHTVSRASLVDIFPFLDSFLPEADAARADPQAGRCDSAVFCAVTASGQELQLVASALRLGDDCVLILDGSQPRLQDLARLLQRARQADLVHQRLARDVLKRDILFHCIVHDLTSQLSSLRGVLQLLSGDALSQDQAELVATGLRAASKQEALIRDILDVFCSESGSDDAPVSALPPCDLSAAIADSLALLSPTAAFRGVRLVCLRRAPDEPGPTVRAEGGRLARVLDNLLENALRHAPRGSAITVTLSRHGDQAEVTVDDDGPGVPAELGPALFEKFARQRKSGGKTGLGLYFCRLTVTRWGGEIGYQPRTPHGARFWFRLPTAGC